MRLQEAVKRNSGVEVQVPASTLAILVPGGTVSAMSSTGAATPLTTHTLSAATDTNQLSSTARIFLARSTTVRALELSGMWP